MGWRSETPSNLARRHFVSTSFRYMCMAMTWLGIVLLAVLLFEIGRQGASRLSPDFLTSFPSRFASKAGIKAALWGTVWLISLTAFIAVPVGVAAAVYLEEYATKGSLSTFIEINIANLAGVPSIVYGLLGLAVFVRFFHLGESVLAGALTMSLLILPVIITASREALRGVPGSLRQAAFGLGATRWQTTRDHVLPAALPGILTGVILSLSRAVGESAPLLVVGAATYLAFVPNTPMSQYSCLPIQIFNWASRPQESFHETAAAAIIVLLLVLLIMNSTAVIIRWRSEAEK